MASNDLTTLPSPRTRRRYISGRVMAEQLVEREVTSLSERDRRVIHNATVLAARTDVEGERAAALAAVERVRASGTTTTTRTVALRDQVHSRRTWAHDEAHVAAFPEHILVCACGQPYDARVNPGTGEHHNRRRAGYCSDPCQNKYKPSRTANPGIETVARRMGRLDQAAARSPEVMRVMTMIRVRLMRPGTGWMPLHRSDWSLLESWAPEVGEVIRFHEDATRAQRIADAWVRRHGYGAAERLRIEAVAAIDNWFRGTERMENAS